jgi:multiple sugar transport system permease protein
MSANPTVRPRLSRRGIRPGVTLDGSRRRTVALMLAPFLLFFALFFIAPALYAAYQSLFGVVRSGTYGPPTPVFTGLSNYVQVVTDPVFLTSVLHVVAYTFGPTLVMIVLALFVALVMDARVPNRLTAFFRLTTFAPYAVPGVIAAILWGFLYTGSTSPVLSTLSGWGINITPLASGSLLWGLGNVTTWIYLGYNVLLFLAQLHTIDGSLLEAARIDGAGGISIALRIKLPLLRPAISLSVIFNVIGTIQLFTEPQTLKIIAGSITSTWTPTMMAYAETNSNNYGLASAIAVIIAVVAGACSFVILRFSRGLA